MAKTYCGIDIGSHNVKVVIVRAAENPEAPMQILGTGEKAARLHFGLAAGGIVFGAAADLRPVVVGALVPGAAGGLLRRSPDRQAGQRCGRTAPRGR